MSSKRRIRRRSCEGKIPYATSETAKTAIYAQPHKWTARMNAYPCSFCGQHHIGHAPR